MKINRNLSLCLAAGAIVGLTVHGCKKQEKEGGQEKQGEAMEVMAVVEPMVEMAPEVRVEAMQAGMEAMDATSAAPPRPADGDTLTLIKKYPVVGTVRTSKESKNMDLVLTIDGQALSMVKAETEESREEVLAVTGNLVTKMKVTYVEKTAVDKMNAKERVQKSPLVGKTFILEMKDGKPVALDEAGQPLAEPAATLALRGHKSFGKPIGMLEALPTTPIKVGDKVDALAEAMKKDIAESMSRGGKGGKADVEGITFTLKEIRTEGEQKLGVFEFTLTIKMDMGKGMTITMNLKGAVTLRAQDGWPVVMAMEGPITVMGKENAGKMVNRKTMTYSGK